MRVTQLTLCILAAFLLAASAAGAEEVESVIITTDSNYPDALIAGVAANYIGAPVLLTSPGTLSAETEEELNSLSPSNIYIIGGPAVVGQAVEETLGETYNVVRLWGMTRYGTAVKVAENFWESSPKALLVWDALSRPDDGNAELISEAKDLAMAEEMPALLIAKNIIPSDVAGALSNLSVTSVILVGNVGSGVTNTLSELGIEISEHLRGEDVNETRQMVRDRVRQMRRIKAWRHMVVIAVGNWSDTIKAPYMPNGTSRHITSEGQIDDVISEIQDGNYSKVFVVGKPELARIIYNRLTDAGINVTHVSGRPAAAAAEVMRRQLAMIREREAAIRERLQAMHQRMITLWENRSDSLIAKAERLLASARIEEATRNGILNELREIKQSIDEYVENGNYTKAYRSYKSLESRAERIAWDYRNRLVTTYRSLMEKETTLEASLEKLRELRIRRAG